MTHRRTKTQRMRAMRQLWDSASHRRRVHTLPRAMKRHEMRVLVNSSRGHR
jgi:hypothetical protein